MITRGEKTIRATALTAAVLFLAAMGGSAHAQDTPPIKGSDGGFDPVQQVKEATKPENISATIERCRFSDNFCGDGGSQGRGGAIAARGTTIKNSTFVSNDAHMYGGALSSTW